MIDKWRNGMNVERNDRGLIWKKSSAAGLKSLRKTTEILSQDNQSRWWDLIRGLPNTAQENYPIHSDFHMRIILKWTIRNGCILWTGFKWLRIGISFCLLRERYKFLRLLHYAEFSFTSKATFSFSSTPLHGVKLLRICYKYFYIFLQFVCAYSRGTSTTVICDQETRNVISFFSVHFL
jgi:hypothetical protein